MTSHSSSTNSNNPSSGNRDGVVLQGYHKKLKTMKKKYFVLYSENGVKSARLEYYDSEKKFKARSSPKRIIILKNCFNINRRLDTKHSNVIALSTKEEVFCIVLETEAELNEWLRALLALQRGEDTESDPPKPFFEHVWQVQMQRKGIAEEKGLVGKYYVCLTTKSVTLVRIGAQTTTLGENRPASVEFYLTTIRRCGDSQCFFFMEVGRHSALGAGELWMQTEDSLIAQNMHTMIISAMSSSKNIDDGFGPMSRKRSSSANEASKPISMTYRRQTHSGTKPMNSSPLNESASAASSTISSTSTVIQNPIIKPSTSKALEISQTSVSTNSLNPSTTTQQDLTNPQQSVVAIGRDRCDSLPSSRHRTASECSNSQSITNSSMPPPARPVLSNRPLSMCISSRHHSPPLSTLSPSTGCSESDGSSLSIDETDSCVRPITPDESGNFVGRYFNSHPSDGVIPEENYDDPWFIDKSNVRTLDNMNNANGRLTLPISTTHSVHSMRKTSPAASQAGSVDMQSQYMDMFSPYSPPGTSPCDQTVSGFMPVSPSTDFPRGLYTGSSGGHSRASSLAEETVDGYVPMCPTQLQDYVDMEQSSKHHTGGALSSAASSCSITSGTPSTDIRFAEYPLDKVKSRFTPDDEDLHPANERPIRAYSVGSRPEHIKRKLRVEAPNTADQNNSRVRAFSVGSRATKVPRCDLYRNVLGPNPISCQVNNNNINNNNNLSDILGGNNKNKKSSSAPILVHKSQNSVDRMSDLMEIDFSKNSENHNTSNMNSNSQHQSHSHSQTTTAAARYSSYPLSVPSAQQKREFFENSPKANSSGYLEMKPGSLTEKPSPTSGHKSMDSSGYLEMRPIGATRTSSLSSSPIKASTSAPKSISSVTEEANYTNMSPSIPFVMQRMDSEDYMNMSPHDKHWDIDNYPRKSTSTPDGYMEMSFNKNRSTDSEHSVSKGPTGINLLGEVRNASLPIDIVSKEKSGGLSFTDIFSKFARRSDSHESDVVAPIPLHPNSIFSFSPGSPVKGFVQNDFAQRKCFVDATSGTVTLSEQKGNAESVRNPQVPALDSSMGQSSRAPDKEKILNTDVNASKKPAESVEALSNDYADMSLGSGNPKKKESVEEMSVSDYVNYIPPTTTAAPKPIKVAPKHDYAIMSQRNSTFAKKFGQQNVQNKKQLLVTIAGDGSNSFTGFKPISSSTDESLKNSLKGVSSPKSVNRQLSDQSRPFDDNSSGYELLQMRSDSSLQTKKILSRPNSVNSEKISPSKTINRPNSANSECMPSISTSSSTSTLCGSSSSSSTLCGSKSQSPLTNSRPQSFSDTVVGGVTTSRPESVSSIADPAMSSRPPSVSSEREILYATLDLPPSSNNFISSPTCNVDRSSSTNVRGNSSTSGESSTSPSPNANGGQQQPTFGYAQIDFDKCESLKLAMNAANNQKNQ